MIRSEKLKMAPKIVRSLAVIAAAWTGWIHQMPEIPQPQREQAPHALQVQRQQAPQPKRPRPSEQSAVSGRVRDNRGTPSDDEPPERLRLNREQRRRLDRERRRKGRLAWSTSTIKVCVTPSRLGRQDLHGKIQVRLEVCGGRRS
jgi:hypothetical protein